MSLVTRNSTGTSAASPAQSPNWLAEGTQARADRHNQALPPEVRGSEYNQNYDHYLVGNEMAGPQYPLYERLGAVIPAVAHEVVRPLLSPDNTGLQLTPSLNVGSSAQIMNALNKVFGTPDEPVWINKGEGAGGAAAEKSNGLSDIVRNLTWLYRGATGGETPQAEPGMASTGSIPPRG